MEIRSEVEEIVWKMLDKNAGELKSSSKHGWNTSSLKNEVVKEISSNRPELRQTFTISEPMNVNPSHVIRDDSFFKSIFDDIIDALRIRGVIRFCGGNGFEVGSICFTMSYEVERNPEGGNIWSRIPKTVTQGLVEQTKTVSSEISTIYEEVIQCYNANLARPAIILLSLAVSELLDLLSKNYSGDDDSIQRRLREIQKKGAEGKIESLRKALEHEELQSFLRNNQVDKEHLISSMDRLRRIRNEIVHPPEEKTVTGVNDHISAMRYIYLFPDWVHQVGQLLSL